jgi:hypothetical protein
MGDWRNGDRMTGLLLLQRNGDKIIMTGTTGPTTGEMV